MDSVTVIAIGGNSLIRSKDRSSFADQLATTAETCRHIADIVAAGHEVVITHGNGPQVGFILIRSHLARNRLPEIPLDVCNAQTQAEIGYMIQQSLDNEFKRRGIAKPVVTLVTQVVVDAADPAFRNPSKPVGPFYTKGEAARLERELGWVLREDAGRGFRRLVPSPRPVGVVEKPEVESLLRSGAVVVACGGGIVVNRDNIKIMKETGRIICLRASLPVILKRIRGASHRPLLNVKDQQEQIKCLLKMRAPFYASADRSIDTSRLSIDEVISRVSRLTGEKKNKPGRGNRKPAPKRKAKVKKI